MSEQTTINPAEYLEARTYKRCHRCNTPINETTRRYVLINAPVYHFCPDCCAALLAHIEAWIRRTRETAALTNKPADGRA